MTTPFESALTAALTELSAEDFELVHETAFVHVMLLPPLRDGLVALLMALNAQEPPDDVADGQRAQVLRFVARLMELEVLLRNPEAKTN